MRLFEIAPPRHEKPDGVLITILQFLKSKGDARASGVRIPTSSVVALMANAGHNVDFAELENIYNNNSTVKNLMQKPSEDEIIINTREQEDQPEGDETTVANMAASAQDNIDNTQLGANASSDDTVSNMAKNAASNLPGLK